MMRKLPWLNLRKKTDSELPYEPPIMLGNKSNGEFFWEQTPRDRKLRELILRTADERARHLGMDRRHFMASALGMATSLWAINALSGCGGSDGGYDVGSAQTCEEGAEKLRGDEFIFDVQTHHIEDEETWKDRHPGGTYGGNAFASFITLYRCELDPRAECIGPTSYVENVFLNSETTVAVLSGFPSRICDDATLCTNLNSNEGMAFWRDYYNDAASGSQRVVQHCQVAPNDRWEKQAEMMERIRATYGNRGWKCYPPWGPEGQGWWLDDEVVAGPFIEKCIELREPLICAHKGFPLPGFDREHADPKDIGPAAVRYPDVKFVVYHSAFDAGEGPYDPNGGSVNRLVRTVEDHGLKGKNVFAEMGSAWALMSNNAIQAQHYIGKLLKYIGEENILWGSECVWFGSPQPQIEAFRALTISTQFQEEYGYPALTPEIKAKIFGLNAARIYGIDPEVTRCTLDTSKLTKLKLAMDTELGDRRWAFQQPGGPQTRAEFLRLQKWRRFTGTPA
jgi:predicted TIM-barrel fold metal-dependent hydrolase